MISSKFLDVTHLSQVVRDMCIINTTCGFDTKMKNALYFSALKQVVICEKKWNFFACYYCLGNHIIEFYFIYYQS